MTRTLPRRTTAGPRRVTLALVAGALAAGLLVGCAGDGSGDSGALSESGGASSADRGMAQAAESVEEPGASPQQMVTSGSVEVVVSDPLKAAQEISVLVEQAGGRTEERSERAGTETSQPWANLTVRVPADKVTATIDALETLGTVESTQISSTDVTNQSRDLDARIEALQLSTTRLETLMSTAATTADLLDAESTLTDRQGDLESLEAQRALLSDQVDMSTLHISLSTEPAPATIEKDGFLGGLKAGWAALLTTVNAVVVIVGTILPWLVVVAVVALVVRGIRRSVRRPATAGPASTTTDAPAPDRRETVDAGTGSSDPTA